MSSELIEGLLLPTEDTLSNLLELQFALAYKGVLSWEESELGPPLVELLWHYRRLEDQIKSENESSEEGQVDLPGMNSSPRPRPGNAEDFPNRSGN